MSQAPDSGGDLYARLVENGPVRKYITDNGLIDFAKLAGVLGASLILAWVEGMLEWVEALWNIPATLVEQWGQGYAGYIDTVLSMPATLVVEGWRTAYNSLFATFGILAYPVAVGLVVGTLVVAHAAWSEVFGKE